MSFTITDAKVDKLPSKDKDYVLTDANLNGFAIKVTPAGKKVFLYQQRTNGKILKITLGKFPNISTAQARELAKINAGKISQGINPNEEKKQQRQQAKLQMKNEEESKKKSITFREFWHIYDGKHVSTQSETTAKETRRKINKYLLPYFGDMPLSDIKRQTVLEWQKYIEKNNFGKSVFGKSWKEVLRPMFSKAEIWGYVEENANPCYKLESYKAQMVNNILSEEQIKLFIDFLSDKNNHYYQTHAPTIALIKLAAYVGWRRGQILVAKWEHVDFQKGEIYFPKTKTGEKVLPLSQQAIEVFQNIPRKKDCDYIFWSPVKHGKPLTSIQQTWNRIRKQLGLKESKFRLHDLRHTFITHVLRKTNNLALASKLAGHANIQTTMRYTHLATQDLKVGLEKFGEIFAS